MLCDRHLIRGVVIPFTLSISLPSSDTSSNMRGTIKSALALLSLFAWSNTAQNITIVRVLANSTELIVSQHGVPLSPNYLNTQDYAGYIPDGYGGVMMLNSTIDTAVTLIFDGMGSL
ncbi:hypothetical protein FRB94_014787 [Tulasnella sp. JGI-2019a]|nr:hypothetical protein FRB94_014787 [Tulasnella sp. JGI-2019a]KAG9023975.1 hypothetical protein FRB95_012234 [Tulasnella sp. JGI-2019a]